MKGNKRDQQQMKAQEGQNLNNKERMDKKNKKIVKARKEEESMQRELNVEWRGDRVKGKAYVAGGKKCLC